MKIIEHRFNKKSIVSYMDKEEYLENDPIQQVVKRIEKRIEDGSIKLPDRKNTIK